MAISLASLSKGVQLRAPRVLLLGVEKIGKTTFACGSHFEDGQLVETGLNNPVVIATRGEEGADALDVPVFPPANSFVDVLDAIGALYEEDHEYKTLVIDSASALEPLIWDAICEKYTVDSIEKVGGGYGKGYIEAAAAFRGMLNGLDALRAEKNMASIIIGHVKVKRFDDPAGESYDQYQFDVNERTANLLFRWVDLILFANTKVVVKKEDQGFGKEKKRGVDVTGGQRFLYTQKRPAHPGGGRGFYGQLPYELPLDYRAFEDAVTEAAERGQS
jgi:hypothetical protein